MVFDRRRRIDAPPDLVWPWIVQLGKGRAGWYLPRPIERCLLARWRAARIVDAHWQHLEVGQRVPDYGGRHDELEVVSVDPPHALVYRADRYGTSFSWALLLTASDDGTTEVHLRFRGALRRTGWRRRALLTVGGFFDRLTGVAMLAGLAERVRSGDSSLID